MLFKCVDYYKSKCWACWFFLKGLERTPSQFRVGSSVCLNRSQSDHISGGKTVRKERSSQNWAVNNLLFSVRDGSGPHE